MGEKAFFSLSVLSLEITNFVFDISVSSTEFTCKLPHKRSGYTMGDEEMLVENPLHSRHLDFIHIHYLQQLQDAVGVSHLLQSTTGKSVK